VIIATEQSPTYAWSFAAGMFTAYLYYWFRRNPGTVWQTRALPAAGGLAVAGWIVCGIIFANAAVTTSTGFDGSSIARSETLPNLIATASRATLILCITLGPLWMQRIFDNRFASSGAGLSYGLYLIHLPIAFYLAQLLDMPDDGTVWAVLLWSALVFPLSLAWAWVSSRFVGRPAIAWTEKRLTKQPN
jgi:peptidoglycan/LPS O-acetylase OafA/YrhL